MALKSLGLEPCWHLHVTTLWAQLVGRLSVKPSHLYCHFFRPDQEQIYREQQLCTGLNESSNIVDVVVAARLAQLHLIALRGRLTIMKMSVMDWGVGKTSLMPQIKDLII